MAKVNLLTLPHNVEPTTTQMTDGSGSVKPTGKPNRPTLPTSGPSNLDWSRTENSVAGSEPGQQVAQAVTPTGQGQASAAAATNTARPDSTTGSFVLPPYRAPAATLPGATQPTADLIAGTGLLPNMVLPDLSKLPGSGGDPSGGVHPTVGGVADTQGGGALPPGDVKLPSADIKLPSAPTVDVNAQRGMLEQWRGAADAQTKAAIDYAVQQAITELQRAEQDAQAGFKEQAESVSIDERQGMDNSALYAEARGDKGGIGQAQYNEIQAAAAQNRLAVQQQQTKLSTDTARQIADLRAKGEFEKADAMLETAQTYLSQLVQLEQWAASYGMDAAQFEASLAQWQAEYDMAMKKFGYQQERDKVSDAQWQYSQTASMGEALLDAGMMPSDAQLAAMGLTKAQAQQWIIAAQLKAAQEDTGKTTYSTTDELYQALKAAGKTTKQAVTAQLELMGYDSENYVNDYLEWLKNQGGVEDAPIGQITRGMYDQLDAMMNNGGANAKAAMVLYISGLNISDEDKVKLAQDYNL